MESRSELIRTRFAPSPTGDLHIGGARTALFNYLLARQQGGQFILRVEDTDLERNQQEKIKEQYQDLIWLGLKPNESPFDSGLHGPYQQTSRLIIYQGYVQQLLVEKKVYYCFCSKEELEKEKKEFQEQEKRMNYQYSRKCLNLTSLQIKNFLISQKSYLIRLQIPNEKTYEFTDLVRGKITFQSKDIEDFVIFRSTGVPLMNFAVTIDDHLMEISHVLRGEEHLSNTSKQLVLYEALGWQPPLFGHLSLILNSEKKKLSKRDPETSQWQLVKQLREKGYLPQAIVNYLLFLGWHPSNTEEIFSLSQAVEKFNLAGSHTRGAVYSLEKLNWYNNYYIQQLTFHEFTEYSWKVLKKAYNLKEEQVEWSKQIAALFQLQLNYFQELVDLTSYFFQRPDKQFIIKDEESSWTNELNKELNKLEKWEEAEIKAALKIVVSNNNFPKKEFFLLVRKILTGREKGPELPKIIWLLGYFEISERLK